MAKSMKSFLLPTCGHYTECFTDDQCDSLKIIENEFGLKGFAVVIKLWQKIFGSSEGYYINWNDRVGTLFAIEIGAGKGFVFEIVNRMIAEGLFDERLFKEYGILTADYIQRNWHDVKSRSYQIEEKYSLIECLQKRENADKCLQKEENADKCLQKSKNVCKKPKMQTNVCKTDAIEYNRIELKEKENNLSVDRGVFLTDKQLCELQSLSSVGSVETYIAKLYEWQKTNGKRCRDPFSTIKKWIAEDNAKYRKPSSAAEPSFDLDRFEDYANNLDLSKIKLGSREEEIK